MCGRTLWPALACLSPQMMTREREKQAGRQAGRRAGGQAGRQLPILIKTSFSIINYIHPLPAIYLPVNLLVNVADYQHSLLHKGYKFNVRFLLFLLGCYLREASQHKGIRYLARLAFSWPEADKTPVHRPLAYEEVHSFSAFVQVKGMSMSFYNQQTQKVTQRTLPFHVGMLHPPRRNSTGSILAYI